MTPLAPPDNHHVSAAIGWVELGNVAEAAIELAKVSEANREHPATLEVEWVICAERKDWQRGLEIAETMTLSAPEFATGWLHRAYALRRVEGGGLQAAWNALLPAYEKFPNEPTIAYNLACYACQLGKENECRDWLQRALKLLGKDQFKKMALADQDLKSLWQEIQEL